MPLYEYECQACGHYLETLQKISDPVLTDCPACGKPELKKLISAAGFRLKGGGWYETDFKNKEKKKNLHEGTKSEGKSGESGANTGTAAGAGTDKAAAEKPAAKTDTKKTPGDN